MYINMKWRERKKGAVELEFCFCFSGKVSQHAIDRKQFGKSLTEFGMIQVES